MTVVSCYFFAGDFLDVMHRFQRGEQQIYQTHNEVARLVRDLLEERHEVNLYSFVTAKATDDRPAKGLRVVNLGAANYSTPSLLKAAVEEDRAECIIAHFPNQELLQSVVASNRRAIAVLANSYNKRGIKSLLERRKIVKLLNDDQFEFVSNHCLPATEHLAQIGVERSKLIAWDISHPFAPTSCEPKVLKASSQFELVYVGSITEAKGVSDLIHAVSLLRRRNIEIHCALAGLGDIEAMRILSRKLGVADSFSFFGLIGNDEVFRIMRSADLVVVPSRTHYTEGFPLVMFEALSSRTPIVCSDHPMFRSVMIDGENASVFPAGNSAAFAAAIATTLSDPALYARLSAAAPRTWKALEGPADWRTMLRSWVNEGISSPWLRSHMLAPRL
ncbi:glycosyltransferase family 4 protein [Bradyrhizobium genosp. P]|uniref:glycosyltransferase family 4 protein n=1 Tax=Bradyrhizobium genosp. P TaxID=83641 RepID=UPI003CE6C895